MIYYNCIDTKEEKCANMGAGYGGDG